MAAETEDGLAPAERVALERALAALGQQERGHDPSDALFERVMADAIEVQAARAAASGLPAADDAGLRRVDRRHDDRGERSGRTGRARHALRRGSRRDGGLATSAAALVGALAVGLFFGGFGGAAMARFETGPTALIVFDGFEYHALEEIGVIDADERMDLVDAGDMFFGEATPF
ncbi:MAG: hypothetical protein AAGG47_07460 [Pseudomonadota bacterium]